jgi:hypothetical protein
MWDLNHTDVAMLALLFIAGAVYIAICMGI